MSNIIYKGNVLDFIQDVLNINEKAFSGNSRYILRKVLSTYVGKTIKGIREIDDGSQKKIYTTRPFELGCFIEQGEDFVIYSKDSIHFAFDLMTKDFPVYCKIEKTPIPAFMAKTLIEGGDVMMFDIAHANDVSGMYFKHGITVPISKKLDRELRIGDTVITASSIGLEFLSTAHDVESRNEIIDKSSIFYFMYTIEASEEE